MRIHILLSMTVFISSQLFFSCVNNQQHKPTAGSDEYPIHIPFEKAIGSERDLKLNEIADSVRLIPLETTDASLLNRILEGCILKSSKYWFLYSYKNVYQFTDDGKFVRTIGSIGNGPGEYVNVTGIDINEASGHIYVMDTAMNINIYDIETGDFLYARKAPNIAWAFAMINDSVSACYQYNVSGREINRILVGNAEGDTIKAFRRSDLFELKTNYFSIYHFDDDRYMFHHKDMICYKEYYNDTLFVVTTDTLKPRYVFDLGKHSMPTKHRPEVIGFNKREFKATASSYIRTQALETDDWIFMPYSYWQIVNRNIEDMHLMIYDKKNKESFEVRNGEIENNMCGTANIPFCPQNVVNTNILTSLIPVEEIFEMAEENPSILDHPQLKGLSEDSNPVLMAVYLKSEP